MRKIVAVIGDANIDGDSVKYNLAFETGKAIIDNGFRMQCGGLGGVMAAACKGARSSKNYKDGDIIGILPSFNIEERNEYIDIAIPTGLDLYRNVIVAGAQAIIAIGGGAGTMCELSNAWALRRLIIAYSSCSGWSAKIAGTPLDARKRYPDIPDDRVYAVSSVAEMTEILTSKIEQYNAEHEAIKLNN